MDKSNGKLKMDKKITALAYDMPLIKLVINWNKEKKCNIEKSILSNANF